MRSEDLLPLQEATADSPEYLDDLDASPYRMIGGRNRTVDGLFKSTGKAVYTDDLSFPGMLHAKILRSTEPHARIRSIDFAKALELPGVYDVITGRDLPTPYGIIPWTPDEHALAFEKVRFIGDAVACVAAIDEETAVRALQLIAVEYDPLPYHLDPREALESPDNPIHEPRKPGHNGNVLKRVQLEFGPVDEKMAGADVVVDGEY